MLEIFSAPPGAGAAPRGLPSLLMLPLLALFTAVITGCSMAGDCFSNATVEVTLDSTVDAGPGTQLVIAQE